MRKCLWSRTAPHTVLETMRKASKTAVTRKRKASRVHLQPLRDDGWQHVIVCMDPAPLKPVFSLIIFHQHVDAITFLWGFSASLLRAKSGVQASCNFCKRQTGDLRTPGVRLHVKMLRWTGEDVSVNSKRRDAGGSTYCAYFLALGENRKIPWSSTHPINTIMNQFENV